MIIALIALVVFLIAIWRRDYGLGAVILLWPAYVVRTAIFGVPTTALEISLYALAVAWIVRDLVPRKGVQPKLPRWIVAGMLLWVAAWAIATAFSRDYQASLGASKAWLIDPLVFGFVLTSVVQTARQRQTVLASIALSGTVVAVAGILQLAWFRETLQDGRLSSFFHPVANYAAMYLGPLLLLTVGSIVWKLIHRLWWVAAFVMFIALMLTVSFGGYLALGIGGLFLLWRWPNKKTRLAVFTVLSAAAIVTLAVLSQTSYLAEKFNTNDRSSSLVRTQIWRTSWEMIKEHPIVGIGPNAFEPVYRATIPKLYFPPLEWLVAQPHQLYLALWLETGLLGLLVFIAFIVMWIKHLWSRVRERDPIAIIAIAAMLAILAHGLVDTPLFKNDLMMIFVIVVLLPFLNKEKVS